MQTLEVETLDSLPMVHTLSTTTPGRATSKPPLFRRMSTLPLVKVPSAASSPTGGVLRRIVGEPLTELLVVMVCVLPALVRTCQLALGLQEHLGSFGFITFEVLGWLHIVYLGSRVLFSLGGWLERVALSCLLIVRVLMILLVIRGGPVLAPTSVFYELQLSFINAVLFVLYVVKVWTAMLTLRTFSRQIVSQKKRRFVDRNQGLDLDLAYITGRIIAMGFPTEDRLEQQFRNPMDQVQRFFEAYHPGHYKVYNLCSERKYLKPSFAQEYHKVRFPDHNPCALSDLSIICSDMSDFISQDKKQNVVAVHCKAGKGRTGLVVASLLMHLRRCNSADEALKYFASRRTHNGKGVTIPSQIRYVHHYEKVLHERRLRPPRWLWLRRVHIARSMLQNQFDQLNWQLRIMTHDKGMIFDSQGSGSISPCLENDVKFVFFEAGKKLFHCWLHTAYDPAACEAPPLCTGSILVEFPLEGERQVWTKTLRLSDLDGPHKASKGKRRMAQHASFDELVLVFESATRDEVREVQLEQHRRRVQLKREIAHRKTIREAVEAVDHDDHDHLEHDTDQEDLATCLCRGYLLRTPGGCSGPRRCLCELDISGRFIIYAHGRRFFLCGDTELAVDLSELGDGELYRVSEEDFTDETPMQLWRPVTPSSSREALVFSAWRVKNPRNNRWELLEPDTLADLKRWDAAFIDVMLLGEAARNHATAFCGFFWKLRKALCRPEEAPTTLDMTKWKLRLFVLRRDGRLMLYSGKARTEVVFCAFGDPTRKFQRLGCGLQGLPHLEVFQITGKHGDARYLAGSEEDVALFGVRLARICANMQSNANLPDNADFRLGSLELAPKRTSASSKMSAGEQLPGIATVRHGGQHGRADVSKRCEAARRSVCFTLDTQSSTSGHGKDGPVTFNLGSFGVVQPARGLDGSIARTNSCVSEEGSQTAAQGGAQLERSRLASASALLP